MKDILAISLLSFVLGVRSLPIEPNTCTSWCVTDNQDKCSNFIPCAVEKEIDFMPPLLGEGESLDITLDCLKMDKDKYGLLIMWKLKGDNLKNIDKFYIQISDLQRWSSISSISISISVKNELSENKMVKYAYAYFGEEDDVSLTISKSLKYEVLIQSLSNNGSEVLQGTERTVMGFCSPESTPDYRQPESITHSKSLLYILISSSVALILLIPCTIALARKYKSKCYDGFRKIPFADSQADSTVQSPPHILILNPINTHNRESQIMDENMVRHERKLKELYNFGKVIYNKRHYTEIAKIGLPRWLEEKISWSHKIVYTSVPESAIENETDYKAFNNVLNVELSRRIQREEYKKMIVIAFASSQPTRCPYWNNERYTKFILPNQWEDFCKCLVTKDESTTLSLRQDTII